MDESEATGVPKKPEDLAIEFVKVEDIDTDPGEMELIWDLLNELSHIKMVDSNIIAVETEKLATSGSETVSIIFEKIQNKLKNKLSKVLIVSR